MRRNISFILGLTFAASTPMVLSFISRPLTVKVSDEHTTSALSAILFPLALLYLFTVYASVLSHLLLLLF